MPEGCNADVGRHGCRRQNGKIKHSFSGHRKAEQAGQWPCLFISANSLIFVEDRNFIADVADRATGSGIKEAVVPIDKGSQADGFNVFNPCACRELDGR
jgi:hypothetical protein